MTRDTSDRADTEALSVIVGKWWNWARVDVDGTEDRAARYRSVIADATEMTRLLARLLRDRGETEGDTAICYVQGHGLNDPAALRVVDHVWRPRLLAIPEAPREDTVISESIALFHDLGQALEAAGIISEVTP